MSSRLEIPNFNIGDVPVGSDSRCVVIAEVGQAHDGSLGTCHAFIDAVADTGVDGIKFQTHFADAESTSADVFRVKFSRQDSTRKEYWRRMEFSESQWVGLASHAEERGLIFLSSPFSVMAVDVLDRLGIPAWKIASGEVTNLPMLERIVETRKPVLLSTGMSPWKEIDDLVNFFVDAGSPLLVFQATTQYPCPPEKTGLNALTHMIDRYRVPVGLSDHSGNIFAGLTAAALGASMLEVHVTMHRAAFGPDVIASVTLEELAQLVNGIQTIQIMKDNPVDKDEMATDLDDLRRMFFKSVVVESDLPVGHILAEADLSTKKPGTGISAAEYRTVIGKKLTRSVSRDHLLSHSDFEPVV